MCNYIQEHQANHMKCSKEFPTKIPRLANWLSITGGINGSLCDNFDYFKQILSLNLTGNGITSICDPLLKSLVKVNSTKMIDLSGNKLSYVPRSIMHGHLERIWISGNQFECNCDMLWMVNWLANTTSPSGGHLVKDYNKVLCRNNKHKGIPIINLNATYLNCLPMPVWGIGLISGAGALIIAIVIAIVAIARRWNAIKFWLYMHCDILDKNDDDLDKLDGIYFDALLSYT